MKVLLIFLLLISLDKTTYGQETILVTKDKDDSYEEYHVLKSDKKIKHGSSLRLSKFMLHGYALESVGYYSHGMRNGYWESYYKNLNNVRDKGYYKKYRESLS